LGGVWSSRRGAQHGAQSLIESRHVEGEHVEGEHVDEAGEAAWVASPAEELRVQQHTRLPRLPSRRAHSLLVLDGVKRMAPGFVKDGVKRMAPGFVKDGVERMAPGSPVGRVGEPSAA
jgi:hypothetical protein